MACSTDGGSAGAGAGGAEHLQHRFPRADPAGQRRLCRERTAARQAQVVVVVVYFIQSIIAIQDNVILYNIQNRD